MYLFEYFNAEIINCKLQTVINCHNSQMFVGLRNVSMPSIILHTMHTRTQTHRQTQQKEIKMHVLCVQLKPNGDYGSLLMFTWSTACIFPLVPLKTVVMSGEVLMWFFHWAIIFLLPCSVQWRMRRKTEQQWTDETIKCTQYTHGNMHNHQH